MQCAKCSAQEFERFPAERQTFLWKGSFPVQIMVPLTLTRCSVCETLLRPKSEIHLIERAIQRSIPMYFRSMLRQLEKHGLHFDAISRRAKIGKRALKAYFEDSSTEPDPEHYRRVIKLNKDMTRKAQAIA